MSFEEDFNWQLPYVPRVLDIVGQLPVSLFTQTRIAPRQTDIKQNGDLVMFPFGGLNIAMRLRRPHKGYFEMYGLEFTIRTLRESGAETEMSKIRRGLGDWFFYGHIEQGWVAMMKDHLRHWVIVDLNFFRHWVNDQRIANAALIDNHDGTFGRAFDLRNLPDEMLIAKSDTMKLAIESGMGVVPVLPSGPSRRIRLPPSLQDLVARFGRYDLITPEAWQKYDVACAQWRVDYIADRVALPPEIPISDMIKVEISEELRLTAGLTANPRRVALWQRLDELVRAQSHE